MTLARAVSLAVLGIGVWAVLFGLVLIAGGQERMQAPSFAVIRGAAAMLGADPSHLWGLTVAAGGLLVLVRRTEVAGLFTVATWCILFGLAASAAAFGDPSAAVTGPGVYGLVAVMISGLIAVRLSGLAPRVPL